MSREQLQEQFEIADAIVSQWPKWKQNLLEDSSKPTVAVPRTPVDNFRESDQHQAPPKQDD
jgi:hypothetical protein